MKLFCFPDFDEDIDLENNFCRKTMEKEFELNWANQVPHWIFLTDEGISFFKGVKNQVWLRP